MANRTLLRTLLKVNYIGNSTNTTTIGLIHCNKLHTNEVPVKEIKIPVKWGHVAGKLWGDENQRPVLALHGWQDNAGTWDPLAPLLCKNQPILAIDFPGHGMSSWIPPGMTYYSWEFCRMIFHLKEYFQWDKVSLLGHSMGSIAACRFASLFPDDVDFYVAVDSLIYEDHDLNSVVEKYPTVFKKLQVTQTRLDEEPPIYTLEEMEKIWHMGTRKSVELDFAPYLLTRGAKQSKRDPTKYYFSRDSRLKYTLFNPESKLFVETLISRLKCPTLYFKAIDSPYANDGFSVEMREVMEKNNENFETVFIPGTHYVHLNNYDKVAPIIISFLRKYKIWK